SADRIADQILDFFSSYLGADASALYLREDGDAFRRKAARAMDPGAPTSFGLGEGSVGEVARSKKLLYLDALPANYFRWVSGLGETQPKQLAVVPLTADGEIQAVVELGLFNPLGKRERRLLERSMELAGIALRSAKYRSQLQDLLHESQQLTEELQT